jgi:hypothetical protein
MNVNPAHFEFVLTTADGTVAEPPIKCETSLGVILLCPGDMPRKKIDHLLEIARKTPSYPVDITHFKGEGENQKLVWSARIYYRDAAKEKDVTDHWKCVNGHYMHKNLHVCLTCGTTRRDH